MARTKNRALAVEQQSQTSSIVKISRLGGYVRLSEASSNTDSESIINQKILIQKYINENQDLMLQSFYEDDGYTGTNFNRHGFERMLEGVKKGEIDGIIVKDLSRFGREQLEVGDYIEKVFPSLGVRFISILDHYDSIKPGADREKLILSLKSLVHDIYPRDISKKIFHTYRITQDNGEARRGNSVPYGYIVREGEKSYTVEEEAARIVCQIMNWMIGGSSRADIAKKLIERNILTPQQHRMTGKIYGDQCIEANVWADHSLKAMLSNREYTGQRISHKTETCLYKGISSHILPESEYITKEHSHPPIVSGEVFDQLQEIVADRKNKYTQVPKADIELWQSFTENIFSGLILCGDCHRAMLRKNRYIKINEQMCCEKFFVCRLHDRMSQLCDTKRIKESELCEIVVKAVQSRICQIESLSDKLKSFCHDGCQRAIKGADNERKIIQKTLKQLEKKRLEQYIDYTENHLLQEEFQQSREEYQKQFKFYSKRLKELEKRKKDIIRLEQTQYKLIKEFLAFDGEIFQSEKEEYLRLTSVMIRIFISKIYIYHDKRVELIFQYDDEITGALESGVVS